MFGSRPKIGYWWSENKGQKMKAGEFVKLIEESGCDLVKLDLDGRPFEDQGPFTAIVHKLSDIMVKADAGDQKSILIMDSFEKFIAGNPEIPVYDLPKNIRILMDRYRQYNLIYESELGKEDGVFTPAFVELTSKDRNENIIKLNEAGVTFPFVCKPLVAHGSSLAHQMSLIFCEEGLKDIQPPCVAQRFINHNARLFKLFVIKEKYFVIDRRSLKNFQSGNYPTVTFDSSDISKPHSSSLLTQLDEKDLKDVQPIRPDNSRIERIVNVLRKHLGLTLFGVDIIIENETGRYAIIDMNAFPGYDGVENFWRLIRDLVLNSNRRQSTEKELCDRLMKCKSGMEQLHNDVDSGIDTSDSCDEKKKKPISIKNVRRQHSKNILQSSTL